MNIFGHGRLESRAGIILTLACSGLALSGCGGNTSTGPLASASSVPPSEGAWVGREQVKEAIELLHRGEAQSARKLLMKVLKKQPGDSVARQLIGQIDGDPVELLGSANYRYTLKEGETLSVLAARHLGSPMMFFALARYNNIAIPNSVGQGQTILLPGRAAPAVVKKPTPKANPSTPKAAPSQSAAKPAAPAAKPAQRPANPAQASRLRGQGLAAMNAGSINRAVALLRQAASLDPASTAIRNDLNRALRIQSTVRAKP